MSINRKAAACLLALMLGSGVGVASNRFVYRAVKDTITQHKDTTKQDVKKGKATEKEKDKPSAYDQLVKKKGSVQQGLFTVCLLYTSPSPRDPKTSRMPSSA